MASTSTSGDPFMLNPLKLPKVGHVINFVTSRTSKSLGRAKLDTNSAVNLMAKEVHAIWTAADCPPKAIKTIKILYKKLILEKKKKKKKDEYLKKMSGIF